MIFDSTIHLGDVITTGVLGIVGWTLRKAILSGTDFIRRVGTFDHRIETTAEVVDLHTDVLMRAGWTKGVDLKPVSQKRRRQDMDYTR